MLKFSTKSIIIFFLVFGVVFFGSLSVLAQADMAEVDVGDIAGTDVSAVPEVPDAENSDFLAEAECELNGQPVPCEQLLGDELAGSVNTAIGWGIGLVIVMLVVGIAAFIFWLMMIIHAASHPIENKAMWIIILVLTGIIGAIIYYFAVKRKFNKQGPPTAAPTA